MKGAGPVGCCFATYLLDLAQTELKLAVIADAAALRRNARAKTIT